MTGWTFGVICRFRRTRTAGSPRRSRLSDGIRLEVSDGGCGFNARSPNTGVEPVHQTGVGVSGMRVRLEQLRGSLQIDSGPAGTRVTATVPLTQ